MENGKKGLTTILIEEAKNGETVENLLSAIQRSHKLSEILLPKMGDMSVEVLSELVGCCRAYAYNIINGKNRPEQDVLLRIAFVLGMNIEETQEMLKIAHRAVLSSKSERDVYIIYGLVNGLDLEAMDEMLSKKGQKPLYPPEKEEKKLKEIIATYLGKYGISEKSLLNQIQCDPALYHEIMEESEFASRDLVLQIALVLGMAIPDVQKVLKIEGLKSLSFKNKRDIYIMNGIGDMISPKEMDQILTALGEDPLWETNSKSNG